MNSSAGDTYGRAGGRVHAVRVQVDELPTHEGDKRKVYDTDVGYVFGESHTLFYKTKIDV